MKRENKNMKTVKKRMKAFKKDLLKWKEYDHVFINDDLNTCFKNIINLIKKNKVPFDKKYINNHVKKLLV